VKKLLLALSISLLGYNSTSFADYVVVQPYLSGNDVQISSLNNNQNAIVNTLNGSVEGGVNIEAGSINTVDLAQAVSPIPRWSEAFGNWTYTGMLPATDVSDLTSDISAGTSYVNGYRIVNAATAHTYNASLDTFVYVNQGGYYQFCEEPNGTSSCGVPPANALLLAEVITDSNNITTVNDLRQLSINITVTTSNFPSDYRDQAFVSRDTTTTLHGEPGSISIGNTIYSRTTDTSSKTIATYTNWIEGSVPSDNGRIFVYAYNDAGSTWDIKFSSIDVTASDTSGNTGGILRYLDNGGTVYRAIGWAYKSADTVNLYEASNFMDIGSYNSVYRESSTAWTTTSSTGATDPYAEVQFYSTGRPVRITYSIGAGTGTSDNVSAMISVDGFDFTDTSRMTNTATTTTFTRGATAIWQGTIAQGIHTVRGRVFVDGGGTATINKRNILIEEI